jgi:hypothetical protein
MDYQLAYEKCPSYLHAKVTGTTSRRTVPAYMKDILQECEKRDCFRVLVGDCLGGPSFDAMDVYEAASEVSKRVLGGFEAMAYVASMGDLARFAENIVVNRGMPVAIFDNVADAEAWLMQPEAGKT